MRRNLERFAALADMAGIGSPTMSEPIPKNNLSVALRRLTLVGLVTDRSINAAGAELQMVRNG